MSKNAAPAASGGEPRRNPIDAGTEALAWALSSGAAETVVRQVRSRARQRRRVALATGGVLAVLALTVGWLRQPTSEDASRRSTAGNSVVVSMPDRQVLPDGSIVELKADARIAIVFTPSERRVRLQIGEAHFQVAKNPARPFVVEAGGIEVRAVGTAFNVQIGQRAVDVLVTEGRVAVDKPSDESASPAAVVSAAGAAAAPAITMQAMAFVDAGYRVCVEVSPSTAPPPVVAVSAAQQEHQLAWRVPRLEFTGTPLSEVIPMFNKYGQARLALDPALGKLQMSGTLRADDTDSLLLLLQNEFGIWSERRSSGDISLARR